MKLKKFVLIALTSLALTSCGASSHEHVDVNNDHKCDTCGEVISEHKYENKSHTCIICGQKSSHVDSNNDHYCDICNTKLTSHHDNNKDHKCDICGQVISECSDLNNDHYCDTCSNRLSDCIDLDKDHHCDVCDVVLSQHEDKSGDGYCDYCGFKMGDDPVIDPIDETPIDAPIPKKVDHRMGYEFTKEVDRPTTGTTTIDLYGINDFHGAVNSNIKLARMGTYIRSKTSQPNTLFIDSGDTWQGSIESNYNRGKLINDVFSYAKLSARTIGNHDFDWGSNKIYVNTNRSYNGYTIPVLGANIYNFNWESKTQGDIQLYNLGREYAIYTLDNGLRVGIVGVIGQDQITSISTNFVKNITFTDNVRKMQEVSDFLRVEKDCDIVIGSEHDAYTYIVDDCLTDVSPVSGKPYVDFVFNAHSHYNESFNINGTIFAQCGANGNAVGHATLTFDYATNSVIKSKTEYQCYSAYEVVGEVNRIGIDKNIQGIVDKYALETNEVGGKVLSTKIDGYFDKKEVLPNLMCEAIFEECQNENIDVDFTYANDARAYVSKSYGEELTYSDIYKSFPFDNLVYIIDVSGHQAMKELMYYSCVYNNNTPIVNDYTTYRIAALDYLAFHTNAEREYDYFPNAVEVTYLKKKDGSPYTYREILADYLEANPSKSFSSYDYTSDNERFTRPSYY